MGGLIVGNFCGFLAAIAKGSQELGFFVGVSLEDPSVSLLYVKLERLSKKVVECVELGDGRCCDYDGVGHFW